MEFEIDFGTVGATKKPEPPKGPLYASVDGRVADLTGGECLFIDRQAVQRHVMTHDVLSAMNACRTFRTMSEHQAAIEEAIPALKGRRADISRVLDHLIERGLMVSAEDLIATASESEGSAPGASAVCVIRTCDRPASLERLVASIPAPLAKEIVVVDDSRDPGNQAANKKITDGKAHHLDRQWRSRFAEYLCQATGKDLEFLESVIGPSDGYAPGSVWNTATLLTAGRNVVFLDDDWVYEPKTLTDASAKLDLSTDYAEGIHIRLAQNWEDDLLVTTDAPWSELATEYLDRTVFEFSSASGLSGLAAEDFRGLSWSHVYDYVVEGKVKSVSTGCYGDSTADTSLWFYILPPDRAGDFQNADQKAYNRFLSRPRYVRGHRRPRLADMSQFTPVSYSNTEVAPPTESHGRGEDILFTALLRYAYPTSVNIHLPLLLRHERDEPHPMTYPSPHVPWASRYFAEVAVAEQDRCNSQAPEDRLRHLACVFRDIGNASVSRRCAILDEFVSYIQSQIVTRLQRAVQKLETASEHFAGDAKLWLEENGKALVSGDRPPLRGWPQSLDMDECAEQLADDANRLADVLEWWPDAWNACQNKLQELSEL